MKQKQQKQLIELLNKQSKKGFSSKQVENKKNFNNNSNNNNNVNLSQQDNQNKTGPSSIFD